MVAVKGCIVGKNIPHAQLPEPDIQLLHGLAAGAENRLPRLFQEQNTVIHTAHRRFRHQNMILFIQHVLNA